MCPCLTCCREDFKTKEQVYSQLSEARKHTPTRAQLCLVHGNLSPEGSSAATGLHVPYMKEHVITKCWVVCRSVPCKTQQRIRNKTNIPYVFLTFILFSGAFSLCGAMPCVSHSFTSGRQRNRIVVYLGPWEFGQNNRSRAGVVNGLLSWILNPEGLLPLNEIITVNI